MKKSLLSNLLISVISILVVLVTAELIMRSAWQMGGWVERPIYRRSQNPYLRYELVPGIQGEQIRTNLDGFRGREYSIVKPKNTFRIIMLGDSETFSQKLQENEALSAQLESILNQQSKGVRYEVLNFGVEGYSTFQELEMLETKGLKYGPDLLILNYCLNDPEPGEYYFDKSFLIRHSALVRYWTFRIKKTLIKKERKRLGIDDEIKNYYYYHQSKYFIPTARAIQEMAKIALTQAGGRKLVVVIFPTSSIMVKSFRENYPYKPLHELVKSIPSDNIVFIDLLDEFNRLNLSPREVSINYWADESHKNPMALGVAATDIYRVLKQEKLIPLER